MKKTKLKGLKMTSVDLVKRGANQKADISFYKNAEGQPGEEEIPQSLLKSVQNAVSSWWNGQQEDEVEREFKITKSSYLDALEYSLDSIIADKTMTTVEKADMALEQLAQFGDSLSNVLKTLKGEWEETEEPQEGENSPETAPGGEDKSKVDQEPEVSEEEHLEGRSETKEFEEGEKEMKIDKSRFTPEELDQYNALIAKGVVEEDEEYEEEFETEKSEDEEMHPEVKKALAEVAEMKKSFEMGEMKNIAKGYALLGKDEDALAETLYEMKKSSEASYNSYIALLDEQMDMVEKSGMFQEIGKSYKGGAMAGDAEAKIENYATEIQKSDASLSRPEAIMKAWDMHPELVAEYEEKLYGGR